MIEPQHHENLAADLEAQVISPLQFFGGIWKGEAESADGFDVQLAQPILLKKLTFIAC